MYGRIKFAVRVGTGAAEAVEVVLSRTNAVATVLTSVPGAQWWMRDHSVCVETSKFKLLLRRCE